MSAFDDYIAGIENLKKDLVKENEKYKEKLAEKKEVNKKAYEEAAEKRRIGDMGSDWRILQKRIDRGETTYNDILSGKDKSEEGKRINKEIHEKFDKINQGIVDYREKNKEEGERYDNLIKKYQESMHKLSNLEGLTSGF
ncbi:MAG: hypothetical protein LBM13_06200 [Candidatus Ancillula sp.]|jgi:hypothetical protein|nr:hypothetical protein [Candidatus Ancillula sp.]